MRRWLLIVTLASCATADQATEPEPNPAGGKGDYYGTDDRQQIRDATDPRVLDWARSIAIVVNAAKLRPSSSTKYAGTTSTLREREKLCSDERFANEPLLGFCSSYLVAPDLVATAGHCFTDAVCEDTRFVFDYYPGASAADPRAIPATSVFACREIVARQYGDGFDYALVRLDRPATGRTPFELQPTPPPVGAKVALLGFPSGMWAKVDVAGRVVQHAGHRVVTSLDSFPGHSGGVVLDLATGRAFGVHVEGSTPSFVADGTCSRTASCAEVIPGGSRCWGATETSVDVFAGGTGGGMQPPPVGSCDGRCGAQTAPCACDRACSARGDCCADIATTCDLNANTLPCLGDTAPCSTSDECSHAMCTCEGELLVTESFLVTGQCAASTCTTTRELCRRACVAQGFAPSTWMPTCSLE